MNATLPPPHLPRQRRLPDRVRLYVIDNRTLPCGSLVYPVHAAYAAAVDAREMRVRVVDLAALQATPPMVRELFDTIRPDEAVWVSNRPSPLEQPTIPFQAYPFAHDVWPILDRWQAEAYGIRYAPGWQPWQLQIHALPLGAAWFRAYVADLRRRFPAFHSACVFALESCDYQTEALATLATLGMSWSCAAHTRLLARSGECQAAGCVGFIVDADVAEPESIVPLKLRGLKIHGRGRNPARAIALPLDGFSLIPQHA